MTRSSKIWLAAMFLVQSLFFWYIAAHRFIDGDEGYFLLAARLVTLHKRPYLDFFFQQTPLLPYIYAIWLELYQISWQWARLLPSLLTALLGTLLFQHLFEETKCRVAAVMGVVLFCSSTLIFAWLPIAKPYSLAGLFLFVAYLMVGSSTKPHRPTASLVLAGVFLGMAGDTRSYVALTLPVFAFWLYSRSDEPRRARALICFVSGFIIGLLPCFYFFFASPSAFLFDNLGYHAIRTDAGLVGMWGQKLGVILMSFLGGPEGNGLQNSLLLILSLGFVFSIDRPAWAPKLSLQIALALGVVSLLPTPVLPQYFCFCMPFLIVSSVCVVYELLSGIKAQPYQLIGVAASVVAVSGYVIMTTRDLQKYLVTGDGIPAVRGAFDREDWRLSRVLAVSKQIDALAAQNEPVASFWPGYIFQTHALPFPGLETDCGLAIADKLKPAQMARFHIVSWTQMGNAFSSHRPRIVVVPNHQRYLEGEIVGDRAKTSLLLSGYSLEQLIGDTSIYTCCSVH